MPGLSLEILLLNPDFKDILSAFAAEQVDYLLVGAYALAVHGYPRATGDIDLWIRCTPENALRVWRALKIFGAPLFDLTISDLEKEDIVFQIGMVPRRIDITTIIDGIKFDAAWPQRMIVQIDDLKIPVIGREDLLRNKKASGRAKDLGDIAMLEGNL